MAKKTYRTFSLKKLHTYIRDEEGNKIPIAFQGGIQVDSTAIFTTSSEMIQKGLESGPGFGRDYFIESVREDASAAVKEASMPKEEPLDEKGAEPLTDVKDIKRFKNLIEMKNYMVEVGIEVSADMNYQAAKAAAKKAGYDFQIQK